MTVAGTPRSLPDEAATRLSAADPAAAARRVVLGVALCANAAFLVLESLGYQRSLELAIPTTDPPKEPVEEAHDKRIRPPDDR